MVLSSTFWSTNLQCNARLQIQTLIISGERFLTGGVFECNIGHRRSVAILCMLYKIRRNTMHPLKGAIPLQYAPVRVARGALVAHRYTYAPPRCRTSRYRRTSIPFLVSLWNELADPVFDRVGLAGSKSSVNALICTDQSCSFNSSSLN